jgi:hypothetical protein
MKWSQPADPRVVEAVISAFNEPTDGLYAQLLPISERQWERSFYWLDASGMALYFLDRIESLDILGTLPRSVVKRLQRNLIDNRQRSASMFEEFLELNAAFQQAGIDFCNLKGFTLFPDSCPDPALRCQLDFDFLVDGAHRDACRPILERRGYVLRGYTPSVWEFKTDTTELANIANLYRTRPQRSVEIHFAFDTQAPNHATRDERLDRRQFFHHEGQTLPRLSSVDQFIGQATHLFGHLCGPSTRVAWLLEFMRHISIQFDQQQFWTEVLNRIAGNREAEIAVGVACLLVRDLFEAEIPALLEFGTIDRVPEAVRLWADLYGGRAVLADFPGTKLHLLLREQLHAGDPRWQQEKRSALLPRRRAPRLLAVSRTAGMGQRLRSEIYQLRYDAFRLRFHIVEGILYLAEARRWRRALKQNGLLTQPDAARRTPETAKSS